MSDDFKVINPALRKLKCIECNYGPLRLVWQHGTLYYNGKMKILKFLNKICNPNGQFDEYICDNCHLSPTMNSLLPSSMYSKRLNF